MKNKFFPKLILLIVFTFCFCGVSISQEKYSKIKLQITKDKIQDIVNLGVVVDGNIVYEGDYAILEISEKEVKLLEDNGYKYEVLIDDMSKYYQKRNEEEQKALKKKQDEKGDIKNPSSYIAPTEFTYGSMGSFHTLTEINAVMDTMAKRYPTFVSPRAQIGTMTSIEGRPIYYVKLSNNVSYNDPKKPQVLFNALHHAREPEGMESELFFMWYLLENYNTNDSIKFLVDNTQMYFVPCVNVDGYTYNQTTNSTGGGMWRKNRRHNSDGTYGVDLNRNYGYHWVQSTTTSADDYSGTAGFSEPETQIMEGFAISHDFEFSISIHCYGNYMIHPWGYSSTVFPPDYNYFHSVGKMLTKDNGYLVGNPYQTVGYTANGGSLDWYYGEQTAKNRVIEYSPEAGSSSDGFWPTKTRIIPNCQNNMYMNLLLAQFSHQAIVKDLSPSSILNMSGTFDYNIKRLSVDPKTFYVKIVPLDQWIQTIGDSVTFAGLDTFQVQTGSINYTLNPSIQTGQPFSYNLIFSDGKYVISRTIKKVYNGATGVLNQDEADNSVLVYPNPIKSDFAVSIDGKGNGDCSIKIENSLGQVIFSDNFKKQNSKIIKKYNLSNFPKGVYIAKITTNNKTTCIKLFLE